MNLLAGLILTFLFVTAIAGKPVNVYNFVRAETDRTIKYSYEQGGFGVHHQRALASIEEQPGPYVSTNP